MGITGRTGTGFVFFKLVLTFVEESELLSSSFLPFLMTEISPETFPFDFPAIDNNLTFGSLVF